MAGEELALTVGAGILLAAVVSVLAWNGRFRVSTPAGSGYGGNSSTEYDEK